MALRSTLLRDTFGTQGSSIEPRHIPRELLQALRFGWPKNKQKGLRFNAKVDVLTMRVTMARRLRIEIWALFISRSAW